MLVFAIWPPGLGLLFYVVCWIVMPKDPLLLTPPRQNASAQNAAATP
jgi:phage shock protein PspC (stress-responsive transcriptional regulator)